MEQLRFIRDAGETRRFHTFPVLRQQNNAEHGWHQAMLLWFIYGGQEPGISMEMMMAALTSDMAEHKVGDIPSPAKRNMEQRLELKGAQTFRQAWNDMEQEILREQHLDWNHCLSVEQLRQLQLTDSMDGALYCIRERAMGNQLIVECFMNYISYIKALLGERPDPPLPSESSDPTISDTEWEVFDFIQTEWALVNGN